MHVQARR